MRRRINRLMAIGPLLIALCGRTGAVMDTHALPQPPVDRLIPLDVGNVTVEGELGRRIDLTIDRNLLALDIEGDFLAPFREKTSEGSWEYIALGKLLDSTVRFAACSGDARVLALKTRLAEAIRECQEPDGYVGIFAAGKRLASLWDIHEMSYLILGMLSDYRYFGESKSLECACKMMDYLIANWERAHPWTQAKVGLDYSALQLYRETGDEKYLEFCLQERGLADWRKPIKLLAPSTADEDGDGIDGHHAYAYMDECLAQLDLYRIRPDQRLLRNSQTIVDFLTRENGLFITGSCSHAENWSIDQNGEGSCEETCATAYLLRLLEGKLRLEGDSLYGDIMERAIYNALFAAQAPDGRKLRYFTPFEGPREYFHMDTSCCPGNFRRIMADLPSMIYYRSDSGLTVNLYTQSSVRHALHGDGPTVEIRQQTDYPNSGEVVIDVEPSEPVRFSLSLRIPRWCREARIAVNGVLVTDMVIPGTFFTIDRTWEPGDEVELSLPMEFRLVKGRAANLMKVAVMRGPVLFCVNPSLNTEFAALAVDGNGPGRLIGLNPGTLRGPVVNGTVRPDGMGARVGMWVVNREGQVTSLDLLLTEFPDPEGQMTYLPMQGLYFVGEFYGDRNTEHLELVVEDELMVP